MSKSYFERELHRIYNECTLPQAIYVQVRQSKAFMDRYYADRLEIDDLAAAAHMSRFHYIRTFQRLYGLTPRAHLRDLRISKAKALIKQGFSITQVCVDVGYQSLPTFSSVFKKCTGHSPRQYKQLNSSNRE